MDLAQGLGHDDLARLTREMVELDLATLEGLVDEDVTFVPEDPEANDTFAAHPEDEKLAWTYGHVVVHAAASSEEAAALALTLARGCEVQGRSRYEVPWEEVRTVEFCRQRLEESLRMRLAMLEAWPDPPHLDNLDAQGRNAVARFLAGLSHDDSHVGQLRKIAAQARAARGVAV